ncbi:amidohydrolase family protein [Streptomyces hawaiiensis]|uniref:amidohydrolase family protein n=1 Tax=Streptomyces hawaiiensis TaxID=67305 RepID=UPI003669EBB9
MSALEAADVEIGLSAAWYGPHGPLISNDEVAEFVAESGGRLRGVAGADLARPVQAVRELRRAVEELGFVALPVVPWLWELPPTDRLYYPLYAACVELDIPFCTQVGHTGPLKPSETGRPIPYIDQAALDFPELTITCGHIGYPWTTEMIAVADKHENVYIRHQRLHGPPLPARTGAVSARPGPGQGALRHELSDDHPRPGAGTPWPAGTRRGDSRAPRRACAEAGWGFERVGTQKSVLLANVWWISLRDPGGLGLGRPSCQSSMHLHGQPIVAHTCFTRRGDRDRVST